MGIWEAIGSIPEAVKRNAPAATPVKRACITSYHYGSAAFTKIDQAVRINSFHGLTQWMPDKDKLELYASKFAKNAGHYALQEGYKMIPGGVAFSKILTNTLNDVKHENLRVDKLQASEEYSSDGRKLIDGAEMHSGKGKESSSSERCQPEDVIRIFMMKEFFGTRFLDDLMVPKVTRGKKPE